MIYFQSGLYIINLSKVKTLEKLSISKNTVHLQKNIDFSCDSSTKVETEEKKMELGFSIIVTMLLGLFKHAVCHFNDETLRIPKW